MPEVRQALRARLGRRAPWIITGLFWAIFATTSLVVYGAHGGLTPLAALNGLLTPALVSFAYGFLSPMPWQWTGDSRPQAGWIRGSLQSLAFLGLLITALTALSYALLLQADSPVLMDNGHRAGFLVVLLPQLFIGSSLMTLIGGIITAGESAYLERRETARRLREAQDVLLRGQLAPHALFNALNGLAELVRQDPRLAETAILDLSALLREVLRQSTRSWSTLGAERDVAERFLRLEALRLGARLDVAWDWDTELDDAPVPCLLVQPLVENALKHGIAPEPAGGRLRIQVSRQEKGLRMEVANTGRPAPLVLGEGVGLTNLETRLQLAYEGRAAFRLFRDGAWTRAEVLLPEAP